MKPFIASILAAAIALGAAPAFAAGPTATATASSDATVVKPIAVTNTGALDFGKMLNFSWWHAVRPSDASATNCTRFSDGPQIASDHGSCATFNVSGEANAAYSITLPASITLTGPGSALVVDNFGTEVATYGSDILTRTLDASGHNTFAVGAMVHAALGTQAPGVYAGSFAVTVSYN